MSVTVPAARRPLSGYHAYSDFEYCQLAGQAFQGAHAPWALFQGAQLAGATFTDCTLTGAHFDAAQLAGARFRRCDLRQTTWLGANWADIFFEDCTFTYGRIGALADSITIQGLNWPVLIGYDAFGDVTRELMAIGCQVRTIAEWADLDRREQLQIDGRSGAKWWSHWKKPLLSIARSWLEIPRARES
ncbi:MAG: pentapeptide repeat-containing protein [Vulcanimicrobiaceae bacterium]